jgi:folate-binding protein YgfZ
MGAAEITALEEGRAFVDLSSWRKIAVRGSDAVRWLNDLVSNRVDDTGPGDARRTLLLDRTGRIRANVHAYRLGDGLLLAQDPVQPRSIAELLAPYQLSSDVELTDRTEDVALLAHPGQGTQVEAWAPSILGTGFDRLLTPAERDEARAGHSGLVEATEADIELWRIRRGVARFGVDFGEDALPAEAGWERLVDTSKGCFLGQEAVAKVRNLGHPPRVMVSLHTDGHPRAGEAVLAGGEEVGRITGVAPDTDGTAALARIRWEARELALTTSSGHSLQRR